MKVLRSIALAFSMFSRIPVPKVEWKEENMGYIFCAFPLIGVVIGLCLWGWVWLCAVLGFGVFLQAAGLALLPVLVTGGIHLDGFCDTIDALASHAEPARKQEILKDPHNGAFAVIGVCAYFLLYFGLCTELLPDTNTLLLLTIMHVLSRVFSGLSSICFHASAKKGLLSTFKESASKKGAVVVLSGLLILCAAGMLSIDWVTGGMMLITALVCMLYLFVMSQRQFSGMSGDLAGYFLQLCELCVLAALVLMQKVVLL